MKVIIDIPEGIVKKAAYTIMAADEESELPTDFVERVLAKETVDFDIHKAMAVKDAIEAQFSIALGAIAVIAEQEVRK